MRFLILSFAAVATLAARAGDAPTDPIVWTPPKETQLFIERVAINDYAARFEKARVRAAKLAADRAKLPARGVVASRVSIGAAQTAGVVYGDILVTLGDKPLLE